MDHEIHEPLKAIYGNGPAYADCAKPARNVVRVNGEEVFLTYGEGNSCTGGVSASTLGQSEQQPVVCTTGKQAQEVVRRNGVTVLVPETPSCVDFSGSVSGRTEAPLQKGN